MDAELRESIRSHYAEAARRAPTAATQGCCGSTPPSSDPVTRDLYSHDDAAAIPIEALQLSLGCGNPTALAELKEGEVVLDLGSGGGIDVLLSARRVGATGKAYGLDMTDEMLDRARENQRRAGLDNVEFLKGTIEEIPLPDATVDVVISNCVINLSTDKAQVLREAHRVLRPGGRLAVSDMVLPRPLPKGLRRSVELWAGCIAGALLDVEYVAALEAAGFVDIAIEPTRVFSDSDLDDIVGGGRGCCGGDAPDVGGASAGSPKLEKGGDIGLMSAFIRARKPEPRDAT